MVEHRKIRCQCIECGDKEEIQEGTVQVFVERKGVGVYCHGCGEQSMYPMCRTKDGR